MLRPDALTPHRCRRFCTAARQPVIAVGLVHELNGRPVRGEEVARSRRVVARAAAVLQVDDVLREAGLRLGGRAVVEVHQERRVTRPLRAPHAVRVVHRDIVREREPTRRVLRLPHVADRASVEDRIVIEPALHRPLRHQQEVPADAGAVGRPRFVDAVEQVVDELQVADEPRRAALGVVAALQRDGAAGVADDVVLEVDVLVTFHWTLPQLPSLSTIATPVWPETQQFSMMLPSTRKFVAVLQLEQVLDVVLQLARPFVPAPPVAAA